MKTRRDCELAKRERELQILSTVAGHVHAEDDADRILGTALHDLLIGLDLKAGWILLGNEESRQLRLAASRGVSPAYLERVAREGLSPCLCADVFESGRRMQARNTTECPRMPMIVDGLHEPVAHACIPLLLEGRSCGVLNVAARPGELFEESELRFLETVGRQIFLAVERARHLAAERLFNREALALARINKAIGGSLDVATVLGAIGDSAREVLGAEQAVVLLGGNPRSLEVAYVAAPPHPVLHEGKSVDLMAESSLLTAHAQRRGHTLTLDDAQREPSIDADLARRWGVAALVVAPFVVRGRTTGLLVVSRPRAHRWSDAEVGVAEALATQAGLALENARLYTEARRAYRELTAAQSRMLQKEKMATLGTFASGLAHEVRNPLNSISLQLSRLERRTTHLEPALTSEIGALARIIREEIKRLDDLVGDVLLFSRTSRVAFSKTSLDALVEEVMGFLRPEAQASRVTLVSSQVGEPAPPLALDPNKIKQLVLNLLRNAIEAIAEGGTVTVETGLSEGRVRLAVRDTGPGLPVGLDPFQLFVTTKPRGTGLGLSIAQQIVLEHGGEISAQNQPGGGAAFLVTLPVASEEQGRPEEVNP